MERIIVIGGGIVGASAAFHLAADGYAVTVIDRHHRGHATAAGAGIIAPGSNIGRTPTFFAIARDAVAYYPRLLAALADVGEHDTRYEVVGALFLATSPAELEQLDEAHALFERRFAEGMPNLGAPRRLDGDEARKHFPALADVPGAIYLPEAARVDGDRLRQAMLGGAVHHGARLLDGEARITSASDTAVEVECGDERLSADRVIVAAGSWANAALQPLGLSLPVSPQKGQIMHLAMDGVDTARWPVLTGFYNHYILTFGPDRVVCGATRETGSGFDLEVTLAGLHEVTAEALRIAPGLADGTLVEMRVGLRPLSDDGLPFIDRVPGSEAVIVCTGHGPTGLQLGPWSGRLAAELATDTTPSSDIEPFRLGREMPAAAHA